MTTTPAHPSEAARVAAAEPAEGQGGLRLVPTPLLPDGFAVPADKVV
jgi:hypothetical protein